MARSRKVVIRDKLITLAHGAGGKATRDLVEGLFAEAFANDALAPLSDSAVVPGAGRLAVTTDSYVVRPLRFPGGDIGALAVHGTVNDLAVAGAAPRWLTAGFVLEEGFPIAELGTIVASMAAAARAAGVAIVAGDTKVVERGKADGLYITTAGVGVLGDGIELGADLVRPGDRILLSGTLADHGMAVLIARGELALEADIESDTAPIHELAARLVALGESLRWMRDPTRGGLATALNELTRAAGVSVRLVEGTLPIRPAVAGACEVLGIDPLYVANEGKLVCVCPPGDAERLLGAMREHPLGRAAAIVGAVHDDPQHFVQMRTAFGGTRVVDWLTGEQLPRIC